MKTENKKDTVKKSYSKPQMKVVKLKHRANLLQDSGPDFPDYMGPAG